MTAGMVVGTTNYLNAWRGNRIGKHLDIKSPSIQGLMGMNLLTRSINQIDSWANQELTTTNYSMIDLWSVS